MTFLLVERCTCSSATLLRLFVYLLNLHSLQLDSGMLPRSTFSAHSQLLLIEIQYYGFTQFRIRHFKEVQCSLGRPYAFPSLQEHKLKEDFRRKDLGSKPQLVNGVLL